jgi:hypothetical protein
MEHYLAWGASEGRAPNAWFDAQYYKANNADLDAAGLSGLALYAHYEEYGYAEGRVPSAAYANFDADRYLAENADLGAAGITAEMVLNHYLAYGITEGRTAPYTGSADGQTFTLTTAQDIWTGTTGNDIVRGVAGQAIDAQDQTTLNSSDVLDGGSGDDLLVVNMTGALYNGGATIKNIETIQIGTDIAAC